MTAACTKANGINMAQGVCDIGVPDVVAEGADDAVGGAGDDGWIGIGRAQAGTEFARKTIVQAFEFGLLGLRQIEIGKQPPAGDRQIPHQRVLDLAEPAHESGDGRPGNPVGQQEVNILLLGEGGDQAFDCHESVSRSG